MSINWLSGFMGINQLILLYEEEYQLLPGPIHYHASYDFVIYTKCRQVINSDKSVSDVLDWTKDPNASSYENADVMISSFKFPVSSSIAFVNGKEKWEGWRRKFYIVWSILCGL